jgi:hypothetical protein
MSLSSVQLSDHKELIHWKWTVDEKYSTASAYECQWWGSMVLYPAMPVWTAFSEPKCKFFTWLALHDKVLTANNLLKRNWECNYNCSLCLCIHETTEHLLTGCNFSETVWNLVAARFNLPSYAEMPPEGGPVEWVKSMLKSGTKREKRRKFGIVFNFWWQIWKEHNRIIF